MTTRILVPLDGSRLSEQALPEVKKLASAMGDCSIELLYVVDPSAVALADGGSIVSTAVLMHEDDWAKHYLSEQAKSLLAAGIQVHEAVSVGPPARTILDRIHTGSFDYAVMATHGRSGLARALTGSVTERVLREAGIPVIAVHPQPAPSAVDPWPGDAAEAPALIALFSRGDLLSARASEVLATRGAAAVRDLVAALTSDIAEVRQYAARTLGAIATGEPALDALVRRLSDEVWEVRWDAEEAIVRFGSAGIEAVLEELTHAAPDARFNQAVLHVLERAPMDMWETLKPVVQTLRSGDSALSAPIAAAKAIQTLRRAEPAAVG